MKWQDLACDAPPILTHWLDGSRKAALLKKRDELTIALQRDTHGLSSMQAEIDAAAKDATSIGASALIGDADVPASGERIRRPPLPIWA